MDIIHYNVKTLLFLKGAEFNNAAALAPKNSYWILFSHKIFVFTYLPPGQALVDL